MKKITLKLKEVINPGPKEIHVYENSDGKTVSLEALEKPWTWSVSSSCPILSKNGKAIIEKYVEQGIKQHDYKGGWKEAISVLKLNI